jgi:hypothetical protein
MNFSFSPIGSDLAIKSTNAPALELCRDKTSSKLAHVSLKRKVYEITDKSREVCDKTNTSTERERASEKALR